MKGTFTSTPASFAAFSTAAEPAEDDEVGKRHLLAAERPSESPSSFWSTVASSSRLVDLPVLLRRETNACAVGAAALVGAAEGRGRGPRGRDQLRHRQAGCENLRLEVGDILVIDQLVIDGRDRVLPDQRFLRHELAEITRPSGPCRDACSLNHARAKASANWSGSRRSGARSFRRPGRSAARDPMVSIVGSCFFDGSNASGTSTASAFFATHCFAPAGLLVSSHSNLNRFSKKSLLHLVGVCVQVHFRAAADGVGAEAGAIRALPAEALILNGAAFGSGTDQRRIARAVASCRRCGRRRSAPRSLHRSSPCGRTFRGCRAPIASGSGLPSGPSGLT